VSGTRFVKLNEGWYAEPNACDGLKLAKDGDRLVAKFVAWEDGKTDVERWVEIEFNECSNYQVHTWRAESFAHGEGIDRFTFDEALELNCDLNEIIGDAQFDKLPISWNGMPGKPASPRHFILMFRDYTLECCAGGWSFLEAGDETNLKLERPEVQLAW